MIALLYLTSLSILPIVVSILSNYISGAKYVRIIKLAMIFFSIHNILYYFGCSLKGDYADYIIFSFEYPIIFFITLVLPDIWKNFYTKTLKVIGMIIAVCGVFWGLLSSLLGIAEMEFISDKRFNYVTNNKTYETRRYSFGHATLEATRYTFDTYRIFKYFPIEKKIDTSVFFDNETELDVSGELKFKIKESKNRDSLIISSGGVEFRKEL